MPRLYREAPLASIWEGSGNVMSLDVLRALTRSPRALEVFLDEVQLGAGADRRLDERFGKLKQQFADPATLEVRARRVVEDMALCLQGSLLVRQAPHAVADAFCASRLAGDGGLEYGTLPPGTDFPDDHRPRARDPRLTRPCSRRGQRCGVRLPWQLCSDAQTFSWRVSSGSGSAWASAGSSSCSCSSSPSRRRSTKCSAARARPPTSWPSPRCCRSSSRSSCTSSGTRSSRGATASTVAGIDLWALRRASRGRASRRRPASSRASPPPGRS